MKKIVFIILPLILAVLVFVGFIVITGIGNQGALQVTSIPKSTVYLDGKSIGQTPLCECEQNHMIKVGEYTIKLVPLDSGYTPFESKITIGKSVLTVVDRTFDKDSTSQGSIITLTPLSDKKKVEILAISFPDNATVFLDNNMSGKSPLVLKNVSESDHALKISKDGYKDKIIRIRTVAGYTLSATAFLSIDPNFGTQLSQVASSSASSAPKVIKIIILDTPTGYLNVRDNASVEGLILTKVFPKDTFDFVDEKTNWIEVRLPDGRLGWISSQYAQKQE